MLAVRLLVGVAERQRLKTAICKPRGEKITNYVTQKT
jgi:hypothetical protein